MSGSSKNISVLVAQFPVTLDIQRNLESILAVISSAEPQELVVLPEGALSGYAEDPSFLKHINTKDLSQSLVHLKKEVIKRRLHIIFGSCLFENEMWYNTGIYYGPCGEAFIYRKVNLATSERGVFTAGSRLPVFNVLLGGSKVKLGIQLCREIRYPEQWRYLAIAGAQVFVYLTNAVGDQKQAPVWRSHLISRAAENQRFVLSTNNAHPAQKCPSMIISPTGEVYWEILSSELILKRYTLDLNQVSNWYLSQSRDDLFG